MRLRFQHRSCLMEYALHILSVQLCREFPEVDVELTTVPCKARGHARLLCPFPDEDLQFVWAEMPTAVQDHILVDDGFA